MLNLLVNGLVAQFYSFTLAGAFILALDLLCATKTILF